MFTGIVHEVVTITAIKPISGGKRFYITLPKTERYRLGDSILLNGICSTVVECRDDGLAVEYMAQTERLTTVGQWQAGQLLNCEAPLTLQTKISGSLVTGHVDCTATIVSLTGPLDDKRLVSTLPTELPLGVIAQGSITIDGVNLTITGVTQPARPVQVATHIIPHTWQHSIIQYYQVGQSVNIEFDYIAKLVLARFQS